MNLFRVVLLLQDDYDLLDAGLLNDNKLGFVQFHDNKFKIQGK